MDKKTTIILSVVGALIVLGIILIPTKAVSKEINYTAVENYTEEEPYEVEEKYTEEIPQQDCEYVIPDVKIQNSYSMESIDGESMRPCIITNNEEKDLKVDVYLYKYKGDAYIDLKKDVLIVANEDTKVYFLDYEDKENNPWCEFDVKQIYKCTNITNNTMIAKGVKTVTKYKTVTKTREVQKTKTMKTDVNWIFGIKFPWHNEMEE
jgi:hypothetical protein